MTKGEKTIPKVKRPLRRSWVVVQGSYRPDGIPGNVSFNHYYDTKEKALKGWADHGPSWACIHPRFTSLREVTKHAERPFVTKEIRSLYSVGPFQPCFYGFVKIG